MEKKVYKIDATGERIGRLATKIASILLGKNSPAFKKNEIVNISVEVSNASKMDVSEKRISDKKYISYSGYPGGLVIKTAKDVVAKKGLSDMLKRAVDRMIPKNKLRSKRMNNLKINE